MNEGIKYERHHSTSELDPTAIAKETILQTMLTRSDLTISHPEIYAYTDMNVHPSIDLAIADLQASGIITTDIFASETTGNAFQYHQLNWQIPEEVTVSVSADVAIKKNLNNLNRQILSKGIKSLDAEQWCLRYILSRTRNSIQDGTLTVPLSAIGWKVMNDLHDEGVEKWFVAYRNATAQALNMFEKHPDSRN